MPRAAPSASAAECEGPGSGNGLTEPATVVRARGRVAAADGRLPSGLPAPVTNSFNPADWGTGLEISQIDRYDPAALAAKLPPQTALLLTCSNADQYFTCAIEDRIAAGVAKAGARIDFVHLDGVDHILKEDIAGDSAVWNQALAFSAQLRSTLKTFAANELY